MRRSSSGLERKGITFLGALALLGLAALAGCANLDQQARTKHTSVATLPDVDRDQVEALKDYALARTVRIRTPALAGRRVGSGAVLTPDGWIVTAAHVVGAAEAVTVVLGNGLTLEGRVKALSEGNDYALLRVDASHLPHFRIGAPPEIGDRLVAFSAAHRGKASDEGAVSAGMCIYPSVRIPGEGGTYYYDAVFHSAPIFRGDSGGALVNLQGELVGIHGGFASEKASVAPSMRELGRFIEFEDGLADPGASLAGRDLPVRWDARAPEDFAESTRWTVDSVASTLEAIYAPGEEAYVRDTLADVRARYLALREREDPEERSDADLVRAMLASVFEIFDAHRRRAQAGGSEPVAGQRDALRAASEE